MLLESQWFNQTFHPLPAVVALIQVMGETLLLLRGLVVLEEGNLSAGDQLVTRGKESLFEGAKLRIQQQSPPGSGEAAK